MSDTMDGGGASLCAKTITLQQEVTVIEPAPNILVGKRVFADVIVTCNRMVGHTNRHAFLWTRPDPEDWPGES